MEKSEVRYVNAVIFGSCVSGLYMSYFGEKGNAAPPISKMRLPAILRMSLAHDLMSIVVNGDKRKTIVSDWHESLHLHIESVNGEIKLTCYQFTNNGESSTEPLWTTMMSEGTTMGLIKLLIPSEVNNTVELTAL